MVSRSVTNFKQHSILQMEKKSITMYLIPNLVVFTPPNSFIQPNVKKLGTRDRYIEAYGLLLGIWDWEEFYLMT